MPTPYQFHRGAADGVWRRRRWRARTALNDGALEPEEARRFHADLIRQVVRMLCAGIGPW
ncbi:MAG: hypothetical protein IPJ73_22325 [Zoogloea sp.]|nr:hypothetical protein [Zoogloea sp.]